MAILHYFNTLYLNFPCDICAHFYKMNLPYFGITLFFEWSHMTCWNLSTLSKGSVLPIPLGFSYAEDSQRSSALILSACEILRGGDCPVVEKI